MILRCVVRAPSGVDLGASRARVQVEDVTEADAAAHVVASASALVGEPVELDVPEPPEGRRWIVRAIVQRGHALAAGDLLTTVAIPVPRTDPTLVELPLTPI
jgi:hypothetical protein